MYRVILSVVCLELVSAILLDSTDSKKLPQYSTFGRSLVLVGGGVLDNQPEIFDKVVELAGGRGLARIGVVTASSSEPADSFTYYRDMLKHHGSVNVSWISISENDKHLNSDPVMVSLIRAQTGYFFSGGDQTRVLNCFFMSNGSQSPALQAMLDQYNRGAVIAGTSAGTACQTANVMMAGGLSYDALSNGAYSSPSDRHPDDLVYDPRGGLGFLHGFVLDTHFSERGREGRMIRLLSDTRFKELGTPAGIGVDEKTALVITHAGTNSATGTVIGPHGVVLFDVSQAIVDKTAKYFTIRDVYLTYLTSGDSVRLSDQSVTFAHDKTNLKGHEHYDHALTSKDIFHGSRADPSKKSEFIRVATSVFDAKYDETSSGTTNEKHPRFVVSITRGGSDAHGYIRRGHSFQEDLISYQKLMVKVQPD